MTTRTDRFKYTADHPLIFSDLSHGPAVRVLYPDAIVGETDLHELVGEDATAEDLAELREFIDEQPALTYLEGWPPEEGATVVLHPGATLELDWETEEPSDDPDAVAVAHVPFLHAWLELIEDDGEPEQPAEVDPAPAEKAKTPRTKPVPPVEPAEDDKTPDDDQSPEATSTDTDKE